MNSFLFAFETVFPLCAMLMLGFLAQRLHWIQETSVRQMNQVCFYLFLPMSLFSSVYHSSWESISWKLILFAMGVVMISFLIILWMVHHTSMKNIRKGVIVQGTFRSNFILFGLPLTISFFGEQHAGTTAILIAFIIPLYNVLSILVLQGYGSSKSNGIIILKKTCSNPLIIGAACAFVCVICNVKLLKPIEVSVQMIASSATPLALFLLGASFVCAKVRHNLRVLMIVSIGKLLILPGCVVGLAWWFGFRQEALIALLAMSASPTAVSSYTMAQSMNMDHELAGQIVVFTTVFSILSLFLWISFMRMIGV